MTEPLRIALIGAGLIGRQHASRLVSRTDTVLSCIVDPTDAARAYAGEIGAPWVPDVGAMLDGFRPDGAIVATPNQMHCAHALACIGAGVPVLVEKPLTDIVADGEKIVAAAKAAGVPVLVGHHRRHSATLRRAKELLESGTLGQIVSVNAMFWLYKPADYFNQTWRTKRGAGPVFLNLIHDIDSLRYLLGDIVRVQARLSSHQRGFEVEDTAAIIVEFKSGALGTISVSDTVVAPWSWEMTSGENKAYPHTAEPSYFIGGTHGSLAMPNMVRWHNRDVRGWWEPLEHEGIVVGDGDPLVNQLDHWCAVLRGAAAPLVSAEEGLKTLAVIDAIQRSAATGEPAVPVR
ncbi:MAG TPA: Gfo/Idh/MocA family oxidoreductase [Devosia sp.]|nr:Gfo/Idh/MocA family oxidoreductase [Devosia sp.]